MNVIKLWNEGKIEKYQDLCTPSKELEGWRGTSKTWNKIKEIANFKDKTVLDVGCNYGYFIIKSLINGAKKATGVDLNISHNSTNINLVKPLTVAKRLMKLWGFTDKVELIKGDWVNYDNKEVFNIVLCFNTIHYFSDVHKGVNKLFKASNEAIILETSPSNYYLINSIARENKFCLKSRVKSHWNMREIILFEKT